MDVVLINKCVYFLSWSVVCLSLSCPWQRSPVLCPGAVCLRYRRLPVVPFSLRLHSSCSPQSIQSVLREADCKVNSLRSWIRWWRLVSTLNGFKRGVQRKWKLSVSCGSDLVEIKTLWPTECHYSNKRRIFTGNNLINAAALLLVFTN